MFGLGCLVAFLTLSVSVALTLLVPLVANGYLKREDTIPYIAGANITTLADTLVAAVILGNPDAVRVVLAEVIGVSHLHGPAPRRRLPARAPRLDRVGPLHADQSRPPGRLRGASCSPSRSLLILY